MTATEGQGGTKLVLVAMTLANAMILVDQTAVPLALPDIMRTFRVGSQTVQWVLNGSCCRSPGCSSSAGGPRTWSGAGGCSCSAPRCSRVPRRSVGSRRRSGSCWARASCRASAER